MKEINIYKSNIYINIRKGLINSLNLLLLFFINCVIKINYIIIKLNILNLLNSCI